MVSTKARTTQMVTSNKEKAPRQTKAKQIRVLIVDDHEVVRVGLQTLLRLVPEMQVVGEAGTMSEAVSQARTLNPNVILMDIRLPDGSGVDACREIRTACPDTKVLFLTSYADEDTVLDAILSGAHGYVLKEIGANSLIEAIQTVAAGHSLLHPEVTEQTMKWLRILADPAAKSKSQPLSEQERRVLALVAEGKTNKEIAADLNLSDKTVKNYLANIYDKLQVSRRSEAAAVYSRKYEG